MGMKRILTVGEVGVDEMEKRETGVGETGTSR